MDSDQQPQPNGLPSYMLPADPARLRPPSRPHRRRLVVILLVVIAIVIVAAVAVAVLRLTQTNTNFQAYAPKNLPSGVSETSHKKSTTKLNGTLSATVTINSNSKDFSIKEQKSTQASFDTTLSSCKMQLQDSLCLVYQSPAGTSYDVRTNSDPVSGKPVSQSIAWLKDNTGVWISLQGNYVGKYSNESWGKVVDSFVPATYGSE